MDDQLIEMFKCLCIPINKRLVPVHQGIVSFVVVLLAHLIQCQERCLGIRSIALRGKEWVAAQQSQSVKIGEALVDSINSIWFHSQIELVPAEKDGRMDHIL